jgi:hypothetical protein
MHRKLLVLAALGALLCGPALAQTTPKPGPDAIPEVAPGADPPNANTPKTDLSKQGGNLSDKLNSSNGVIHPEGSVDPQMQKPAPATGATPVIPPPGAPGGDRRVQPK